MNQQTKLDTTRELLAKNPPRDVQENISNSSYTGIIDELKTYSNQDVTYGLKYLTPIFDEPSHVHPEQQLPPVHEQPEIYTSYSNPRDSYVQYTALELEEIQEALNSYNQAVQVMNGFSDEGYEEWLRDMKAGKFTK